MTKKVNSNTTANQVTRLTHTAHVLSQKVIFLDLRTFKVPSKVLGSKYAVKLFQSGRSGRFCENCELT